MPSADRIVFITILIGGVFFAGLELGKSEVACPVQLQGERLITTTTHKGQTVCQYLPAPTGRILNRRKA